MDQETILQRKRHHVRFTNEEILLILRSYRAHPTQWGHILADVKANINQLQEPIRQLYSTASDKQLKERMSVKLGKLMTSKTTIADPDIRHEIELVKAQERRNVSTSQSKESNVDEQSNSSSQQGTRQVPAPLPDDNVPRNIPQTAPAPVRDASALIDGMIRDIILSRNNEEPRDGANLPSPPTAQLRPQPNQGHQRNAIAANLRDAAAAAAAAVDDNNDDPTDNNDDEPPVLRPLPNSPQRDNPNNNDGVPADIRPLQRPANQPAPRPRPQQRQVDRRDAIAADLSDDDEPQPQRRRLSDLIRENHELYNRFMTRTLPRILEHYGIDLDD